MMLKLSWFLVVLVLIGLNLFGSISADIVGIWLMDENNGNVIKEATGAHEQDGEFIGGVKWTENGKFGSAVQFDGSTGHIEIPDPDNHLTPANITLMAWIKLDDATGTRAILEQYDWAGVFGTHAFRTEAGQLQFWVIWGPTGDNVLGGQIIENEWIHVAGSYDGETIRVFINGKMEAEKKGTKRDLAPSSKSLSIGVRGDTKDIHWLKGLVDEVAIFDEALDEKAIAAIVNSKGGLADQFLSVSPQSKLAVTWAKVKEIGI